MSITKSIGKNTLGGGKKMNVQMRSYERSTHDLSYAWRSTMGIGTLVPFLCEIGLPGDTWDINLVEKVLTKPTTGPLFGSYKMQMDVFTCPIRLYNALLHNNALNVGLDMKQVKLPKFKISCPSACYPEKANGNQWVQVNPSSIFAYLGRRGFTGKKQGITFNATPEIAYYDIFKNYYANKQEEDWYMVDYDGYCTIQDNLSYDNKGNITDGYFIFYPKTITTNDAASIGALYEYTFGEKTWTYVQMKTWFDFIVNQANNYIMVNLKKEFKATTTGVGLPIGGKLGAVKNLIATSVLKKWKLTDIDEIREKILAAGSTEVSFGQDGSTYLDYLTKYTGTAASQASTAMKSSYPMFGLALKTLQSDIFNNWINTEWIDGDNGISAITAISTESGSFTIDQLNLSKKVYDMLNRIALSGGTYKDWIETVYTNDYTIHAETPVYEGGASCEIVFNEVVATGGDETLGTLAGRGVSTGHKNGKLHLKIKEPCYIIGIVSITPRVDYCQGNAWHTDLKTMDDLHKPQLDGIGFQDLTCDKMAWWKDYDSDGKKYAIGKQPAWLDYMTNFNKTYGNFAIENSESFMVLNRWYYPRNTKADWNTQELNTTTYINPEDYNYIFADTSLGSQNFWVQIGAGIECRRKMSAKQIPNF